MKKSELKEMIKKEMGRRKILNEVQMFNKVTMQSPEAIFELVGVLELVQIAMEDYVETLEEKGGKMNKTDKKNAAEVKGKALQLKKHVATLHNYWKSIKKPAVFKKVNVNVF